MKTKQEMIDIIYEKIADKTFKKVLACKKCWNENLASYFSGKQWKDIDYCSICYEFAEEPKNATKQKKVFSKYKPIMIWDILEYKKEIINKSNKSFSVKEVSYMYSEIVFNWKYLKKPIEEQSIKCIEYIFNLIK